MKIEGDDYSIYFLKEFKELTNFAPLTFSRYDLISQNQPTIQVGYFKWCNLLKKEK